MMCLSVILVSLIWMYTSAQDICTTPLGERSNCVSLFDCQTLRSAFDRRPLPSHIVTFLRQSQCGFEGYTPRVCCGPLPPEQDSTPSVTPSVRPTTTNTNTGVSDPTSNDDSVPAPRNVCGVETNGDRIFGGEITEIDEFPWMALLGYRSSNGQIKYQCGGVLINNRYVLTAGHCVKGAVETEVGKLQRVRLGEYDIQTDVDCFEGTCADPVQDIPISAAYPHPGYSDANKNRKDDIALVRLSQRAKYTFYVQPICMPELSRLVNVGNDVFVAGWGKTLSGRNSPVKLKLSVPVFDKKNCVTKYRTLGAELTNGQLCAGGVFSQDTCRGDSGGPLMRVGSDGAWETVGVVSFGYGCGRDGWPGVYTSVVSYSEWIRTTMKSTNA